jgi:polyhydroxyalkanoate synthase
MRANTKKDLQLSQPTESRPDAFMMAQEMSQLAASFQSAALQFMQQAKNSQNDASDQMLDPWVVARAFIAAGEKIAENPLPAIKSSQIYINELTELYRRTLLPGSSQEASEPLISPSSDDKRFKAAEWAENPTFSFVMQSYLLWDKWFKNVTNNIEKLDPATNHKVQFYARLLANALSPTNFPLANPQVLKKTVETNGKNLIQGARNFLEDLQQGQGQLQISMVDREAFKVGGNIATTPGKVIFQNDLFQLIQYQPTTEKVHKVPLLLIPPCINKFYIFDLRAENSFVRWVLDQGITVFMISWVNPDERLSHKSFEDYILEGIGEAVEVVRSICQVPQINTVGFCIGGNFLATYTAYKAGQKAKHTLASTTYFATLFDFSNAGDLLVFIDKEQFAEMERKIQQKGYFDGTILAQAFNLLRANDLIWSFVINNYLLGKEPQAFDLLFWNSDSTDLPADMYLYYLKKLFLENRLIQPGGITVKDQPIDLRNIKVPTFMLSTREDHIAPWQSGYAGAQLFSGPTCFVLGGSGHIAGIFNHPEAQKYSHWVGEHKGLTSDEWLKSASQKPGSWWNEWVTWLKDYSGPQIIARRVGSKEYPALEDAPGSYVLK